VARSLHIVASCSDRKSEPPAVCLRDVRARSIEQRFTKWRDALTSATATRVDAEHLYQGGYWTVVRGLPAIANAMGWKVQLWAASAGYGVVKGSKKLVPYSATFARGHEDSVSFESGDEPAVTWWRCATSGSYKLGTSIQAIAALDASATVLVIASPPYLRAMQNDLAASLGEFSGKGSLFIVSSRVPATETKLVRCWLPSRGALQAGLGGALVSLHARTARHLLATVRPQDFVQEKLSYMTTKLEGVEEKKKRVSGSAMSDDEVLTFIRTRLSGDPKLSHTRLLRELRESGRACEQGRFRRLFNQVKPTR
jgi:hypothetical protein